MRLVSELIKCGSTVINKLCHKRLQKLSAKHSEGEPSRHLHKRGPKATASPKIHTWLYAEK